MTVVTEVSLAGDVVTDEARVVDQCHRALDWEEDGDGGSHGRRWPVKGTLKSPFSTV